MEHFVLETANCKTKYEYLDGEIVAMAGAQPEHNFICTNLITTLTNQIRRKKSRVEYTQATSASKLKARQGQTKQKRNQNHHSLI